MAILKDGKYYLKHIYNCWYYLYLFRIFYNKPNVISVQTINPNYFHQNNFFDEVMIVLHIFDSKSEHTFFTLQVSLPAFTQIFYCILRHIPGLQSTSHFSLIGLPPLFYVYCFLVPLVSVTITFQITVFRFYQIIVKPIFNV